MHNLCQPDHPKKSTPHRIMARLLPVSLYKAQFAKRNTMMTTMIKRLKNNEMRCFLKVNRRALCQFSDGGFLTGCDDHSAYLAGINEVM
jgi:hypothetical protein